MSKAQIDGFEFTSDPKTVNVVYSATFTIPEVGPFPAKVREPWIWDGKEWFLKEENLGNPIEVVKNSAPPTQPNPLPFEFSTPTVDFGTHVQGEILKRTIDFKSDQKNFQTFRQNELKGLFVAGITWTSNETGHLDIVLDTTLLGTTVNYSVALELRGWQGQKTEAKLEVKAEIEPRLRFSQTPEIIDPAVAGTAEIQIENLSNVSFRPTSLALSNPAYKMSDYSPRVVGPGQTLKIIVAYGAQTNPSGAQMNVETSAAAMPKPVAVLANPGFVLPLNVKLPVSQGAGYTREELEEMIKKSK
jgi:hypothetical protein